MKFKVKGLVFVGFAAAILSANAMAVDNTVTSKEYVDTKFQTKANITTTIDATNPSDTKYPSESAITAYVTTAGGQFQTKSTVAQQVSDGAGGWQALTKDNTVTEGGTNPVTSGAVYDAIDAAMNDVADDYQAKSEGLSVGYANGVWKTADGGDYATVSYDSQNDKVVFDVDSSQVTGSYNGTNWNQTGYSDNLVTEAAVAGAIAAQATTDAGTYQAQSTADLQIGTTGGVFRDMTTAEKAALASGITSTKVGDYDTHIANTDIHVTTTDKTNWNAKVDTAQGAGNANKTLITDANGNVTVSSQATSVVPALPQACTAGTPCALVTNETTNAIEWVPIAQSTDTVGD